MLRTRPARQARCGAAPVIAERRPLAAQRRRDLVQALASDGPLPALWSRGAQEWVRARIANDEQRLAAQRAIQDVADGCVACRPVLRAWLRGAVAQPPVVLQATPAADTAFVKAWRAGGKK